MALVLLVLCHNDYDEFDDDMVCWRALLAVAGLIPCRTVENKK